jgi:hypothetical protein
MPTAVRLAYLYCHKYGFVSGLFILFHWSNVVWTPGTQHFDYYSFITCFKIRTGNGYHFVLAEDCFGYSESLWFFMNLGIFFSIYVKYSIGIFDRDCTEYAPSSMGTMYTQWLWLLYPMRHARIRSYHKRYRSYFQCAKKEDNENLSPKGFCVNTLACGCDTQNVRWPLPCDSPNMVLMALCGHFLWVCSNEWN